MKTHLIRLFILLSLILLRGYKAQEEDGEGYEEDGEGYEESDEGYDESDEDYSDEDGDEETNATPESLPIEEPIEDTHDDPNHPHISFSTGSEEEHLHNFKRISDDLKLFEDEYIACIDAIHDEDYSEQTIEACLGKDFIKLQLDIKYESMKVISRAEDKLRHFFIYHCYALAGEDEMQALACDLLQKDMLDAIWNCMDFIDLAEANKSKYVEEYSNMPMDTFKNILRNLTNLHKEFFELVEEIDAHKQVTLLRIKTHIDEKTQIIVRQANRDQRKLRQPTIVTHTIKIQEKVKDPNFRLVNNLPRVGILSDGSPDPLYTLYAKHPVLRELDHRGERNNKLRMLNLSNGYDGLHSSYREGNIQVRSTNMSLKNNFRQTVSRLRANSGAFKNIHTSFQSGVHKRFK